MKQINNTSLSELLWFGVASGHTANATWSRYCIDELSKHPDWQLNRIRRDANESTDNVAKRAKEIGISWTRLDVWPLYLSSTV